MGITGELPAMRIKLQLTGQMFYLAAYVEPSLTNKIKTSANPEGMTG